MRKRTPLPRIRFSVSARAALAASLAVALSMPVVAAVAARPSQLPVSPSIGQIRISNRTASNRMWFQIGSLRPNNSSAASPGVALEAVAANGVTLREFIGFA